MGPVDDHKRELCKQAYLLIHKYLHVSGKEGQESFEFRKNLRKKDALDIDLATSKEVLNELNKFKEQGGAALLTTGGSVKATKSKGGLPPLAAGSVGAAPRSAAKPTRSAAAKGKDGGGLPPALPPRIGAKITRWWPKENGWFPAVATDYNPETNCYRLTYNLGSQNETYEDFDLDLADPAIYSITGEKVDLLSMTGSAAVNNSTVLRPYLARMGSGGSGGGGGKSSKKRRSEDDDDDSDYSCGGGEGRDKATVTARSVAECEGGEGFHWN